MSPLLIKYIMADIRKSVSSYFKGSLILIPILAIIGMFATAQHVSIMNQKIFLKNTDYEWISFSTDKPSTKDVFGYIDTSIAHIKPSIEGVYYRDSYPLELYFVNQLEVDHIDHSITYFNKKNRYQGDVKNLSTSDGSLGVALSYNAAKKLKVRINDKASIYFENDEGIFVYPVTVKAILKTKYPSGDEQFGGLGLAELSPSFQAFLDENELEMKYALFGGNGDSLPLETQTVIYKKDQLDELNMGLLTLPARLVTTILLPTLSIIVIFLLIRREVVFGIFRKMKDIGILTALGTPQKVIRNMFLVEHLMKLFISSLLATLIYKYLLFESFIGEMIPLSIFLTVFSFLILLGLISLHIAMLKVKTILNNLSVHEIVSKKGY